MTTWILIGGHIYKAPDGGKIFCQELVKNISHRPVRILDCLFARDRADWEKRFQDDKEFFQKHLDHCVIELAIPEYFIEQLRDSDIVIFQGGKPSDLVTLLQVSGNWEQEIQGKVVAGSSGGADALCKYYGVGKTMRIGEGMGLLPVKFIPHWKSKDYAQNSEIDWEKLLENLKSYKEDLRIITLGDGEFIAINQ